MSKKITYNGKDENLIDQWEYNLYYSDKKTYSGLLLTSSGELVLIRPRYNVVSVGSIFLTKGYTVSEEVRTIVYDPVVVGQAKEMLASKLPSIGSKTNWFYGLGALAMENTPGTFRLTNGAYNGNLFSPKYYKMGWTGGSVARIKTYNFLKVGKALGNISIGIGVGLDLYGLFIYSLVDKDSPNAVSWNKFTLNTSAAAYGYFVPGGAFASTLYFGVNEFYPGGWQGALDNNADLQRRNEKIIPGFNLYQKQY